MMTLSLTWMRALPLLALGTGVFVLAATVDVPAEEASLPARIDVGALHASAPAGVPDPSACADSVSADCVVDAPVGLIAAGP